MKHISKYLLAGIIILSFPTLLSLSSCEREKPNGGVDTSYLGLSINKSLKFQTIHSFGASDAWSCQFVGNWPLEKKQQIADMLFSTEIKQDGSPEGIGLSSWRFNIGAASANQGSASDINDPWRRAEGFLLPDGSYDWDMQSGQRWFLQAASERGVNDYYAFVNSPPVYLTKNGKAYSSGGSEANISSDKYDEFAGYLSDVIELLRDTDGINIDYVSPFNEPQWDWNNPGQEGCPWRNNEISSMVKVLNQELINRSIDTKIEITDAAQIEFLYKHHNRPGRDNQIDDFFGVDSPNYIGNLDRVAPTIAGHSYFSTWDTDYLIESRQHLSTKLKEYGELEYNMSEYTLLEDNSEITGNGRDTGMDPALYMARVLHTDLVEAGASVWQWWLAVSPYDYKDGLVYIDKNQNDGEIYSSKMLWALGNYSRFIRPGMTRIGIIRSDLRLTEQTMNGVMASSYIDNTSGKTVTVALNYGSTYIPIKIDIGGNHPLCKIYRTATGNDDLRLIGNTDFSEELLLAPRSVTTFVEQ